MSTKVSDKVFEWMKNGRLWTEIISEAGKSSSYGGLSRYIPWAEGRVKELRDEISQLEGTIKSDAEKAKKIDSDIEVKRVEVKNLDAEKTSLTNGNYLLKEKNQKLLQKYNEINAKLEEFHSHGLTDAVIASVGRIQVREGNELIERIATSEDYGKLKEEVNSLKDIKSGHLSECGQLTKRLESLKKEVATENNTLDEARRQRWMWDEALKVILSFFKDGYDTETLLNLKDGLNVLAIPGHPKSSIKRYLDGLTMFKELTGLHSEIRRARAELTTVISEVDKATGILRGLNENIIQNIQRVYNEGSQGLERTLATISSNGTREISNAATNLKTEIQSLGKTAEANVWQTCEIWRQALLNLDTSVLNDLNKYKYWVDKWGDEKEAAGKLGDILVYGYRFLGFLKVPEAAKEAPVEVVSQIVDSLHKWVIQRMPEAETVLSPNIIAKDNALRWVKKCKLSTLTEWLRDELNRIIEAGKA